MFDDPNVLANTQDPFAVPAEAGGEAAGGAFEIKSPFRSRSRNPKR
jgi:hypothetical protein